MTSQSNQALPHGYQLLNYRIARQIGGGGFSLVYLAYDEHDQPVAVKEYLPNGLVSRQDGSSDLAVSEDNVSTFRYGMKCFFEEGRSLARIVHPNVVRVVNFFRANETVYMVMHYERGKTLQEHIQANRANVRESMIRRVFVALLSGLRVVHTHKILHLDIKPSNVYIRVDGSPLLIDFGAARQTLTSQQTTLSPMYTPGFAAPEQYANREKLGPWTDIYAIGSSIYACMAGAPPQGADARLSGDRMIPAAKAFAAEYSGELLETVDWCLKLNYLDRPQSVFTLQKILMQKVPSRVRPPHRFMENLKKSLNRPLI